MAWTEETGFAEARRRIKACGETRSDTLDLGGLRLTRVPEELRELTWLKRLYLGGDAAIREKPHLVAFEDIGKKRCNALRALPGALFPALARLEALDLAHNGLTALPADIATLADLTSLNLGYNGIGADGARALAALTGLTSLDLRSNGIGADGARALAALTGLTSLDLGYNGIGADGARALAALTGLTSLDLTGNNIGADGARALAALTGLTSLNLAYNSIGADGARALAALTGLTSLDLADNDIGDISPLQGLDRLETINLSGNQISTVCPEFWLRPSLGEARLHQASLGDVPREVLSREPYENCLPRLRAYLRDRTSGEAEPVRDIKLMLLGNGRIGKTQICNRLRGQSFEENAESTHGVRVHSAELPAAEADGLATPLHIWDFGGQDIYLGTHALFLRTRAIFPIVWTTKAEREPEHTDNRGLVFQNFPLEYWVRYVAEMAGTGRPLLLIQNQVDGPGDKALPVPVPPALLERFDFQRSLAYSAKTRRGHPTLVDTLQQAVAYVHETEGLKRIPGGWAWVKGRLAAMREKAVAARMAGRAEPALGAIAREDFEALCTHPGCVAAGSADPAALLDYLHQVGTVFYRRGLFRDQIVIDQQWALEAIYAVFERGSGVYVYIKDTRGGRFTRSELARFLWDGLNHGEAEQELFLDMMRSCRIAFQLRAPEHGEPEYVAPDLLPPRDAVQHRLDEAWDDAAPTERAAFPFDLLPPGLLRSLMAEVGELAGVSAVYWHDGFYFYDAGTRARAIVEQVRAEEGYAGRIEIRTQSHRGGDAGGLLAALAHLVERHREQLEVATGEIRRAGGFKEWLARWTREGRSASALREAVERTEGLLKDERGDSPAAMLLRPRPTPLPDNAYYISYAGGSTAPGASPEEQQREQVADAFEAWCRDNGAVLIRDRHRLHPGDSIANFMQEIAEGRRIFVVLSAKYLLESHYCMTELLLLWYDCKLRPDIFRTRVIPFRMASAAISTPAERARIAAHWAAKADSAKEVIKAAMDHSGEPNASFTTLRDIAHHAAEILAVLADMVHLERIEDIRRWRPASDG